MVPLIVYKNIDAACNLTAHSVHVLTEHALTAQPSVQGMKSFLTNSAGSCCALLAIGKHVRAEHAVGKRDGEGIRGTYALTAVI